MPDEQLPTGKIPVWRISLTRLQCATIGPGLFTVTAAEPPGVWDKANEELAYWAQDAPDSETEFEPVRYELLFFDARTIVGQAALQRKHREGFGERFGERFDLAQIILLGLHVYVGTYKPANFTWSQYRDFLEAEGARSRQAAAILDGYDFGSEFVSPPTGRDWNTYESVRGMNSVPQGPDLAPGILSYLEGSH